MRRLLLLLLAMFSVVQMSDAFPYSQTPVMTDESCLPRTGASAISDIKRLRFQLRLQLFFTALYPNEHHQMLLYCT